jgi:hypothetical protein
MKALFAAVAIAALVASPTLAQSAPQAQRQHPSHAPDGVTSYESYDVYAGTKRIGRDPDPWIRNEMLRHFHSGWPDR